MRLGELQALVHGAVRGELPLETAALRLGVGAWRLAIYRDFIDDHVPAVLAKVYPHVRALLPAAAWEALASDFNREVPARAKELNACVAPFPEWLADRVDDRLGRRLGASPEPDRAACLPSLAQLEWELFAAFAHPADVPLRPAPEAALIDPAALVVNPTLALLETPFAVVPWLVAHPEASAVTPATPTPEPLVEPQLAMVFRRAGTHAVAFHVPSDDHRFALKVVADQVPLAVAADLAQVSLEAARAALQAALAIGLLM
ncbi:MAG: putative DNA-binding domain-containing protein [Myxococcota bacterium]